FRSLSNYLQFPDNGTYSFIILNKLLKIHSLNKDFNLIYIIQYILNIKRIVPFHKYTTSFNIKSFNLDLIACFLTRSTFVPRSSSRYISSSRNLKRPGTVSYSTNISKSLDSFCSPLI